MSNQTEIDRRNTLDAALAAAGEGMTETNITKAAARALELLAENEGVTPVEYLNALLNYAWSTYRRPGSWEASTNFDFDNYRKPEGCADRWGKTPAENEPTPR